MTAITLNPALSLPQSSFDIKPVTRGLIGAAALTMSVICAYAIIRGLAGIAPSHSNIRSVAIMIHVATVIPAIPLGGFVFLAPKGTRMHKQLGKLWLVLMVATAISAIFIQTGGSFSWIHIFVPITLHGAWNTIRTARAGNIAAHKRHLIGMYLGALMIPGIAAFLLPGRLMNVLLFG